MALVWKKKTLATLEKTQHMLVKYLTVYVHVECVKIIETPNKDSRILKEQRICSFIYAHIYILQRIYMTDQ